MYTYIIIYIYPFHHHVYIYINIHNHSTSSRKAASQFRLNDVDVVLAKLHGPSEPRLSRQLSIHGFPSFHWYAYGRERSYGGGRRNDSMVEWVYIYMYIYVCIYIYIYVYMYIYIYTHTHICMCIYVFTRKHRFNGSCFWFLVCYAATRLALQLHHGGMGIYTYI